MNVRLILSVSTCYHGSTYTDKNHNHSVELPHASSAELKQTRDEPLEYTQKTSLRGREDSYNLCEEFEYYACK